MLRTVLTVTFCVWALLAARADEPDTAPSPADEDPAADDGQAELERQFAETMTGAVLEGSYSVTGAEDPAPKQDKYTLGEVRKLRGKLWLFETRIQYGENDLKLPLTVPVEWAGDTPVISITDFEVPGMGKFTARVLFYRGEYAGTWSAGDHGGQMWGRVVHPESDAAEEVPAEQPTTPE
jgi:hypothetical protein